ncbi:hypothetical protein O181_081609 [Austropuccinia psidii MF-1]|uniref:Uncharacterized protein n=1 Tax=Austropuccinia psidii MF-1 TaxID=1389203 RepID=A0A9Q3FN57_9BASI|nr:hypothetical protein [Austropuccinia psidii MF-1]
MEVIFKKEKKQAGEHRADTARKALQEGCMRLRNEQYKFATSQDFPKRYTRILKPIQAHSDEEFMEDKNVYISNNLPFQSESANQFMRKLDSIIQKPYSEEGQHDWHSHRIHIQNAPTTSFPKALKGFPIDFYEFHWLNGKLPSQQGILADVGTIAFLTDASKSLDFTDEDEKMGDKRFTNKNWDEATKKYNLDFLVLPNDK